MSARYGESPADFGHVHLTDAQRLERMDLSRYKRFDVVIDTDPYNEVDDQFALAYALGAPEQLSVEACYAAPFHNERSASPADGMERSFREIQRVLSLIDAGYTRPVYHGATAFLEEGGPQASEAVSDLIRRAMQPREQPLFVVAIAALTNIASAILLEPHIVERIVVVWLGGHPSDAFHTREFNLRQDMSAARVVLNCGVPLIRIPCGNVAQHLRTTLPELREHVAGTGELGAYLYDTVADYVGPQPGASKVIWDIAPVAMLINPSWVSLRTVTSPMLTSTMTWARFPNRHLVREAYTLQRDEIYHDLFQRLRTVQRVESRGAAVV